MQIEKEAVETALVDAKRIQEEKEAIEHAEIETKRVQQAKLAVERANDEAKREQEEQEDISARRIQEEQRAVIEAAVWAQAQAAADHDVSVTMQANAIMQAWEDGDADVYRAACAADVRMEIPAYGLDIRGFDAIWGVRTSMGAGPLDMHTVHSHSMQGAATVQACATVINRVSGQVQQQSTVRFTFD
jgi:hypothetical protein